MEREPWVEGGVEREKRQGIPLSYDVGIAEPGSERQKPGMIPS